MKGKIICAVVLILIENISFAQQDKSKNISPQNKGYWNLSYAIGIGGNINTNGYTSTRQSGFSYNIDASYTPESNIGFFANYSVTNLEGTIYDIHYNGGPLNSEFDYSELSVGPRLYSDDKNFFIDAGIGYYKITRENSVGINAGAGGKIKFSESYGVLINGRIHTTTIKKKAFVYYGIYMGLELNNSANQFLKSSESGKKFSVTALAGKYNNKNDESNQNTAYGGELSYDLNRSLSLLLNYLHTGSSRSEFYGEGFHTNSIYYYNYGNDISGGVRFYLTGNEVRLFAENFAGIHFSDNGITYGSVDTTGAFTYNTNSSPENYFAISFGAGADFRIFDDLSGILKADIGTYFRNSYFSGFFGGLNYRF